MMGTAKTGAVEKEKALENQGLNQNYWRRR